MAQSRLDFQEILETFTEHVYFQPPDNLQLQYPCIIYRRDHVNTKYADDNPYNLKIRYIVTIIDRDPDSIIPLRVAYLPLSTFNRFYTTENLNHDVYSVYF